MNKLCFHHFFVQNLTARSHLHGQLTSFAVKKRLQKPERETCQSSRQAAAWARFQHGSGSQGKVMHKYFDITRIRPSPKPSRYKLDATKLQNSKTIRLQQIFMYGVTFSP